MAGRAIRAITPGGGDAAGHLRHHRIGFFRGNDTCRNRKMKERPRQAKRQQHHSETSLCPRALQYGCPIQIGVDCHEGRHVTGPVDPPPQFLAAMNRHRDQRVFGGKGQDLMPVKFDAPGPGPQPGIVDRQRDFYGGHP